MNFHISDNLKYVRVAPLWAISLSLVLAVLGALLLLLILSSASSVFTAPESNIALETKIATSIYSAQHVTSTPDITKTVTPPYPNKGDIVSICFTITGLGPEKLDVALVQDVSGSMNEPITKGATLTRLAASQTALITFVNQLQDTDRAAIVPFSATARLAQPLTNSKDGMIDAINMLEANSWTNMAAGINIAHEELISSERTLTDTVKAIILLSDGKVNCTLTGDCDDDFNGRPYAITETKQASDSDIKIFTIGFGKDADKDLLYEIADISGGQYFFAPDGDVLETIYLDIALELHNLVITDVLTKGVEPYCDQWPSDLDVDCDTITDTIILPISDSQLMTEPLVLCFPVTLTWEPGEQGPTNAPGSTACAYDSDENRICPEFENPSVAVGNLYLPLLMNNFSSPSLVASSINADKEEVCKNEFLTYTIKVTNIGTYEPITGELTNTIPSNTSYQTTTGITTYECISDSISFAEGQIRWSGSLTAQETCTIQYQVKINNDVCPSWIINSVTIQETDPYKSIPIRIGTTTLITGVANGNFENEWTCWRHKGNPPPSRSPDQPISGSYSALLGDPSFGCKNSQLPGTSWIEKNFFVPNTTSPKLHFSYRIGTYDTNPNLEDEYDRFDVEIDGTLVHSDANRTGDYAYACKSSAEKNWPMILNKPDNEISLTDYRGRFIKLRFKVRNINRWYNTWAYVDDVKITP